MANVAPEHQRKHAGQRGRRRGNGAAIDGKSTIWRNTDDLSTQLCRNAKGAVLRAVARHHVVRVASVGVAVNPFGKLDVRNAAVQFDERGRETVGCQQVPSSAFPRL
jgi:hypothetical protein